MKSESFLALANKIQFDVDSGATVYPPLGILDTKLMSLE
jgi:hypothetical protein